MKTIKRSRLISRRKEKKLTQEEMSNIIGCSRSHYACIELGTKDPGFKLTEKIISELGVDVKDWR